MWPEADEQEATQAAESDEGVLEVAELVLSTTLDYFLRLDSGDPINPGITHKRAGAAILPLHTRVLWM